MLLCICLLSEFIHSGCLFRRRMVLDSSDFLGQRSKAQNMNLYFEYILILRLVSRLGESKDVKAGIAKLSGESVRGR